MVVSNSASNQQVALIDVSLPDWQTLVAGLPSDMAVQTFSGLEQLAQWGVAHQGEYAAVHLFSHGSSGALKLGGDLLDTTRLNDAQIQTQLQDLGKALTPDGDLLLYGCNVAQGQTGANFIGKLAQITHADVAASNNLTGNAALGGDWVLETRTGVIETISTFSTMVENKYQGLLAAPADENYEDNPEESVDTLVGASGRTVDGITYKISDQNAPADILTASIIGSASVGMSTRAMWLNLNPVPQTFSNWVEFSANNSFKMVGLLANIQGGSLDSTSQSYTITGYDSGGNQVASDTINFANGDSSGSITYTKTTSGWELGGTLNFTGTTWDNIVRVRFTGTDAGIGTSISAAMVLDNLDFSPPVVGPTTTILTASLSADTGSNTTDWTTNTAAQTISGTLSVALITGESVQVSYDNGLNWSNATTYTVGSSNWSTTTTLTGTGMFKARVIDASGSGTAYSHTYVIDTNLPDTTIASNPSSIATSSSASFNFTGTDNNPSPLSYEVNLDGSAYTTSTSPKSYTGLADGSHTFNVRAIDGAGNKDATPASYTWTVDTTAPTASSITANNLSSPSGATFTFTVPYADTGSGIDSSTIDVPNVTVTGPAGVGTLTVSGASFSAGVATYTVSAPHSGVWNSATDAGTYTIGINGSSIKDLAGNAVAAVTSAKTFQVAWGPSTTVATASLSADTGSSTTDWLTNTATQTISGTLSTALVTGELIQVSYDNGTTWSTATTSTVGSSNWSTIATLSNSNTFKARVTNASGGGTAYSHTYTLDTAAPAALTLALNSDSGSSNSDKITNDNVINITNLEAGGTWQYSLDSGTTWTTGTGTSFSMASDTTYAVGAIKVKQTDAAGNVSSITSNAAAFVEDSTIPTYSTITANDLGTPTGANSVSPSSM